MEGNDNQKRIDREQLERVYENARKLLQIKEKNDKKMKQRRKRIKTMNELNKSFTEVSDIINHMQKDLYVKIPKKFIKIINENKDNNYKVNIDYSKGINEVNLLKETRAILSLIYRDYICSPEKRKQLVLEDKEEQKRNEEFLKKKYEINFEKKHDQKNKCNEKFYENNETHIIKYEKQSLFKRCMNKIINLFRKQ